LARSTNGCAAVQWAAQNVLRCMRHRGTGLPDEEISLMRHKAEQPRSPRPNRVLIVDDSDDAAWALASLLQSCGHEVHVAHTGQRHSSLLNACTLR